MQAGDTVKLREHPKALCYQTKFEKFFRGQGNDLGYGKNTKRFLILFFLEKKGEKMGNPQPSPKVFLFFKKEKQWMQFTD